MKLFGSDTNSGMIWKISDWFGMNFNPTLSPGTEMTPESSEFETGSVAQFHIPDFKCPVRREE